MPRPYGDLRAPIPRVFLVRALVHTSRSKPTAPHGANGHCFTRAGSSFSRNPCLHVQAVLKPPGRVRAGSTPARAGRWGGWAGCKAALVRCAHSTQTNAACGDVRLREGRGQKVTFYFRRETAQTVAPSHRPRSGTLGSTRDGGYVGCSSQEGDLGAVIPTPSFAEWCWYGPLRRRPWGASSGWPCRVRVSSAVGHEGDVVWQK